MKRTDDLYEYLLLVYEQHSGEEYKGDGGEDDRDGLVGEKVHDAAVAFDALQQVARELGVEELHGQLDQLDKETVLARNNRAL